MKKVNTRNSLNKCKKTKMKKGKILKKKLGKLEI